ncbi:MAG: RnfABCDGE type electron transport complex subunit G [Bacteroidales bacterium]|nr:RnfABCDGE type electron transport complex subunit G [Bacteroidales bacterium]
MAKKESTFTNMLLTLVLVSLISSAGLGFIYEVTKEPIAVAKDNKKRLAIKRVVPVFTNNPSDQALKIPADNDTVYIYTAINGTDTVGYAIETFTNKGYSGYFKLLAGFLPDGSIYDIAVLEHKESPGLGDQMLKAKSDWSNQFEGKNPENFTLKVSKDGGNVDAITASTITSRAYCDAVQRAYDALKKGGQQ